MNKSEKKIHYKFGERLKVLRRTLKLSQDVFSLELEIPKATYVRYESGKILPRLPFLTALGMKYNANIDWLTFGRGRMFLDRDYLAVLRVLDGPQGLDHFEFAELMTLMEVPEIKRALLVELEKLKQIFKHSIVASLENKKV